MKDWSIHVKMLVIFGGVSAFLIIQMLVTHRMNADTTSKAESGLREGYAGSLLAADMRYNVAQVWQFLTDVSATHQPDGFSDAEKASQSFHKDADALGALLPAEKMAIQDAVISFDKMYAVGKEMADTYMKQGVKAGNEKMKGFDQAGEELSQRVDTLENKITKNGERMLEGVYRAEPSHGSGQLHVSPGRGHRLPCGLFPVVRRARQAPQTYCGDGAGHGFRRCIRGNPRRQQR